jgi:hypothetical protein
LISCFAIRPQQFVQLGVYGLSVAVFGSLNKERHQERSDDRNAVPTEVSGVKNQPKHGVKKHHADDPRAGQPCSSICEKLLELLPHIQKTGPDIAGSQLGMTLPKMRRAPIFAAGINPSSPRTPAGFRDQARRQPTDRAALNSLWHGRWPGGPRWAPFPSSAHVGKLARGRRGARRSKAVAFLVCRSSAPAGGGTSRGWSSRLGESNALRALQRAIKIMLKFVALDAYLQTALTDA